MDLKAIEEGRPGPLLKKDDVVMVGTQWGKAFLVGFRDFIRGIFGVGVSVSRF